MPIAVSMGDPLGVGIDVVLSTWVQHRNILPHYICFGVADEFHKRADQLQLGVNIVSVTAADLPRGKSSKLADRSDCLLVVEGEGKGEGEQTAKPGKMAAVALSSAAAAVANGHASALVTCPINKADMVASGWHWPGHTEFLSETWRAAPQRRANEASLPQGDSEAVTMLFVAQKLRIALCTIHEPLRNVPNLITYESVLTHLRRLAGHLRQDLGIHQPTIAVCGLNPHAGEAGILGSEDEDHIKPAVDQLNSEGWNVHGPLPADGLFLGGAHEKFDAVLAMYHDQGLIAAKALSGFAIAQTTLGLPHVRTSPGHGTARELAGSGRADASGFVAALNLAHELCQQKR